MRKRVLLCLLLSISVLCACEEHTKQENFTTDTAEITVAKELDSTETKKNTEAIEGSEVNEEIEVPETTVVIEMTEGTEPPKPVESTSPTEERHPTEATNPPETTVPTEVTDPPETTSPTEESTMAEWKKAYLEFLEVNHFEFSSYRLVHVDGDDIPELYLSGICEAGGDGVCAFKNGEVIRLHLKRMWGGSFIPGSGMILNCNGNMGYYSTDVYKLTESSFDLILSGLEIQSYDYLENGDLKTTSEYFLGNDPVSEEEFRAVIAAVFDYSQATAFYQSDVSYEEIRQQILSW